MSTGQVYADIHNKRIMGTQDFKDNFLDYLRGIITANFAELYDGDGTIGPTKLALSAAGAGAFRISGLTSHGTDGIGNVIDPQQISIHLGTIPFENAVATYFAALKYCVIPSGLQNNPRSGLPEYINNTEYVGERAVPTSVVDNGNGTITFTVTSVTEATVSHAGRLCMVFMVTPNKNATSPAIAIETRTVAFTGGLNKITTVGSLGQSPISTLAADYQVVLLGPTVRRFTDLSAVTGYWFIGTVVGNGGTPVTFSIVQQTLFTTTLANFSNITRLDSHGSLKVEVKADVSDVNEPQITVKDFAGVTKFSVDEQGNVTIAGVTTQNNLVQVNSSETITDNLTAGDADADSHVIKGSWTHTSVAGAITAFNILGTSGRVGIGGAAGAAEALKVTGLTVHTGDVRPNVDLTGDIGSATKRWSTAFVNGLTASTEVRVDAVSSPRVVIKNQAGAANEKTWRFTGAGTDLLLSAFNDAESSNTTFARFKRTGQTPVSLSLNALFLPEVANTWGLGATASRWLDVFSNHLDVDNDGIVTDEMARFKQNGAGANLKKWALSITTSGAFEVSALTDLDVPTVVTSFVRFAASFNASISPTTADTRDIGTAAFRWRTIYQGAAAGGSLHQMRNSGAGVNQKQWLWTFSGTNNLAFQMLDDISSSTVDVWTIERGNMVISRIIENTAAKATYGSGLYIAWQDTAAASGNRSWVWNFTSTRALFNAANDSDSPTTTLFDIHRTDSTQRLNVNGNILPYLSSHTLGVTSLRWGSVITVDADFSGNVVWSGGNYNHSNRLGVLGGITGATGFVDVSFNTLITKGISKIDTVQFAILKTGIYRVSYRVRIDQTNNADFAFNTQAQLSALGVGAYATIAGSVCVQGQNPAVNSRVRTLNASFLVSCIATDRIKIQFASNAVASVPTGDDTNIVIEQTPFT